MSATQISDKLAIYGWALINTASFLWPCQNYSRKFYTTAVALILFVVLQVNPIVGEEKAASTAPPAAVESSTADAPAPMTDIHDILPPVPVGLDVPWLWIAIIAIGTAALAALAWWLWKRRQMETTVETIVPELPPEMIARQALDQIADIRRLDGKTFYFRLSAILRQYVAGRFGVGAVEMTTEEFLPCIDRLNTDIELARRLKQTCRAMDPVKFGGAAAMETQMEADLLFAREFVRKTTQAVHMDDLIDNGEETPKKRNPNLE